MSQYGSLEHIVDLPTLLGYRLSQIDFTDITNKAIHYSWGDESELKRWIALKDDKSKFSGNVYTISGNETTAVKTGIKYPLIWLSTPNPQVRGYDFKHFDGTKIIVCTNTDENWLNNTRWQKHIPMLQAIANRVVTMLRGNIRIKRVDGYLQQSPITIPNYCVPDGSSDAKGKTLDRWDAVCITADIIVDDSCLDEAYFEFTNN